MKKVYIRTFGCQMNVHDSERMLGVLRREGYAPVDAPEEADLIIFNTCSIREKAEQKFYSQLGRTRRLKRDNPALKVAVAGCIAQQQGAGIREKAPYVDYVIGPQNIGRVGDAVLGTEGIFTDDNPELARSDLPAERDRSVKAWINIMYGCNNFCSYCVVPYTRGRERSRPAENILNEVKGLAADGFKEITLLGQNVNSYSGDVSFPELLSRINDIEGIERIRFVTSHPKDLGEGLVRAMRDLDKVCEHIHLPLQSGSDRVLRLMNRKYTFSEYVSKVKMLREAVPDIAITTDIIAGFPSETPDDHKATVSALQEIGFDGIFAFKYSPRPMTRAADMEGQLPDEVKSERLTEILALQDRITEARNKALQNTVQEVLVEGTSGSEPEKMTGRTRTNKIVNIAPSGSVSPGMILKIRILKANRHSLEGEVIDGA
ncbi:MAG: tRNA (N6-isopentenyl adenosine(37)-C2)-methylthiotransferase MiaB [Nitrospirae bacterium]|nr:tRNA (N6-isopentenyl adenosine(37)-C2)-methylthiotransferase MiaB [Nitrospirota bacterium]